MLNQFQRLRLMNAARDVKALREKAGPFKDKESEARFERKAAAMLREVEAQIKRESPRLFQAEP